jgi:hypothetical protein
MKLGTRQIRKGGQGKVNRGGLWRDRGKRGGVASGTMQVVAVVNIR